MARNSKARILTGENVTWRKISNGYIVSHTKEVKKSGQDFPDFKTTETFQKEAPDLGKVV
tara:strand:- start:152 stop:331 length:180 start_codon:yes stop_codon:yes gene_type:complete